MSRRREIGGSIEEYDVGELLGKGGFASVFRARCRNTGQEVAIKKMNKAMISAGGLIERVRQEVSIHSRLSHPSILQLYTFFEDQHFVYLTLEFCIKGELHKLLKKMGRPLTQEEACGYLVQVVDGMLYLHQHNILHRDLTLANLLLDVQGRVKIADFGLATQLRRPDDRHTTMCGTPNYISPEVATRSSHGLEADVWSLGVMLYTMLVGAPPFDTHAVKSTLTKVVIGDYKLPKSLSWEARDLITKCLQKNPAERIALEAVRMHPFMQKQELTVDSGILCTMQTTTTTRPPLALSMISDYSEREGVGFVHGGSSSSGGDTGSNRGVVQHPHSPPVKIRSNAKDLLAPGIGMMDSLKKHFKALPSLHTTPHLYTPSPLPAASHPFALPSSRAPPQPPYVHASTAADPPSHSTCPSRRENRGRCRVRPRTAPSGCGVESSSDEESCRSCSDSSMKSKGFISQSNYDAEESSYPYSERREYRIEGNSRQHSERRVHSSERREHSWERERRQGEPSSWDSTKEHSQNKREHSREMREACKERRDHSRERSGSRQGSQCSCECEYSGERRGGSWERCNSRSAHQREEYLREHKYSEERQGLHSREWRPEKYREDPQGMSERKVEGKERSESEHYIHRESRNRSNKREEEPSVHHHSCCLTSSSHRSWCQGRPGGKNSCPGLDGNRMAEHQNKSSREGDEPQESNMLDDITPVKRTPTPPVHNTNTSTVFKVPSKSNTEVKKTLAEQCGVLSTVRLRPTRQRTKNVILHILESGDVCLEFLKAQKGSMEKVVDVCRISPDGMRIVLYRPNNGNGIPVDNSRVVPLPSQGADAIYSLENLPRQHWKKYIYAARFICVVKAKTPKVTYYSSLAKCVLMENQPAPDFEVNFYDGLKLLHTEGGITLTQKNGKVHRLNQKDPLRGLESTFHPAIHHFNQVHKHCLQVESVLGNLDNIDCNSFPAIIGRKPSTALRVTPPAAQGRGSGGDDKENWSPTSIGTVGSSPAVGAATQLGSFSASVVSGQAVSRPRPALAPHQPQLQPAHQGKVFVPDVGWASKSATGEVTVEYLDGTKVQVGANSPLVFVDAQGNISTYQNHTQGQKLTPDLQHKLKSMGDVLNVLSSRGGGGSGSGSEGEMTSRILGMR